jgi:hypothetical protein
MANPPLVPLPLFPLILLFLSFDISTFVCLLLFNAYLKVVSVSYGEDERGVSAAYAMRVDQEFQKAVRPPFAFITSFFQYVIFK